MKEKKVLIVDDIPENLQVLSNILSKHNIEIGFAMDGIQALETVEDDPPALILLDVAMPKMDGHKVCKKLKSNSNTSGIPIIFLTAKTETEDIVKGFKLGAVDYITKPFKAEELESRVLTHLELFSSKITIQKQLEELETLNKTKDKFFSIIAHDLKGPINGLSGLADILIEDFDDMSAEQIKNIHTVIKETSKSGLKLLKNLLEWARVQTGRVTLEPRNVMIKKIFEENENLITSSLKMKNIDLKINCKEDLRCFCDYNMINTVVRNLLNNAIKFTNRNGHIIIQASKSPNGLEISVIDDGIGMTDSDMKKLFRIDENMSKLGTEKEKGTGLGLIVCQEYIKMHKGNISVESKEGEGSKFFFTIPNK